MNNEAGPKGGGQDARSKREGHPAWRSPGIHAPHHVLAKWS